MVVVVVFDTAAVAYNVTILMLHLCCAGCLFASAQILKCDPTQLTADRTKMLQKMLPSEEDCEKIAGFTGPEYVVRAQLDASMVLSVDSSS